MPDILYSLFAYMTVFPPLVAAIVVGVSVRFIPARTAHFITCTGMLVSAIYAGFLFNQVVFVGASVKIQLLEWINSGNLKSAWTIRVDVLTAVMLVVVTWVSAVVHLYSVGYMSHDDYQPRFMAYLSLFTFCMIMLVTSDNLIQLFFGWEGVGLCSYLLIGFWFKKPEANAAAMKAFIVNRVGDFGFALGIAAIFLLFGSVEFETIFSHVEQHSNAHLEFLGHSCHAITLICILLFIGAMGKSAQFGLHTWLPDAMEGPTPVSALIHAATMVTAGVFLVARCSPLFEQAPSALHFVTIIGAITAFFAATVALTQNDIKRVIAYSTCSQLGYMFFACGVSAYNAAIFHLMTHAFFKALLFLGAGSVIHAMSGEQDMRKMGGIWKKIPFTYAYMWIGSLALAGVPLFAGYYSKDIILEAALASGSPTGMFAFVLGSAAALMTAFYSWRLLFLTFHGAPRADHNTMHHVHESPPIMLLPLLVLAAGAVFSGYIGENIFEMMDKEGTFWRHGLALDNTEKLIEHIHQLSYMQIALPAILSFVGIWLAYMMYIVVPSLPAKMANTFPFLYRFSFNKWYIDELYDALFVRPSLKLGKWLWTFFDIRIIDGLGPNGAAYVSAVLGNRTSKLQTGYLYHYAFTMLIGLVLIAGGVLYMMGKHGW